MDAEDPLKIIACDKPEPDGAHRLYAVQFPNPDPNAAEEAKTLTMPIEFQSQPVEDGINGLTDEVLLAIVMHRMQTKAKKRPKEPAFRAVFGACGMALQKLHVRTRNRSQRGISKTSIIV